MVVAPEDDATATVGEDSAELAVIRTAAEGVKRVAEEQRPPSHRCFQGHIVVTVWTQNL